MREYLLTLVIEPDLDDVKVKKLISSIEKIITTIEGVIIKKEQWSKRKLSYPILKKSEAQFVFITFQAQTIPLEKRTQIKLAEGVLRYLLLKKVKKVKVVNNKSKSKKVNKKLA